MKNKLNRISLLISLSVSLVNLTYAQGNKIESTGNVGIGITTPSKALEVWTPANDYMSVGSALGAGQFSGISFGYLENNGYYRKSALVFERLDNSARGKIHLLNNGGATAGSATLSDARLTINYDGKIGINKVNPLVDLDVNGDVQWAGYNAGNTRGAKIGYSGGNYGGIGYNIDFTGTSGIFNRPLNDRTSYMEFHYGGFRFYGTSLMSQADGVNLNGNGSNLNLLAILTSTGDLGLGTSTPKEKLSVNGKIRAHEIKVESAAGTWPDYVFTESYQLPGLSETEKFIKEKGHLPGIPSASEVKENGIDLGEMNARLLKKIEELTLHLIRQQKEIDQLKKSK